MHFKVILRWIKPTLMFIFPFGYLFFQKIHPSLDIKYNPYNCKLQSASFAVNVKETGGAI